MTEKEAKTKWCPMARAEGQNCTINRIYDSGGKPDPDCFCLASYCACWVVDAPKWVIEGEPKDSWTGHCGLIRR